MVDIAIYDIEHIMGTERLQSEQLRMLEQGGFVFVTEHNTHFLPRREIGTFPLPNVWYDIYLAVTDDNGAYISNELKTAGINYSIADGAEQATAEKGD